MVRKNRVEMKVPQLTQETVWKKFEEAVEKHPDKKALIYLGESCTFSELKEMIERLTASLSKLGLSKGDRAILYYPNIPQFVIVWYALQRLGCIPIAISPIYTAADVEYISNDSGSEIIFCMDTNFGYVEEVLPKTCLKRVVVTTYIEVLPWWKRILGNCFSRVPSGKYRLDRKAGIFSFGELSKKNPAPSTLPPHDVRGEDLCNMLYTGGTTGLPKGVPYSNLCFLESGVDQRLMSVPKIPLADDILIQTSPLFHIIGQVAGLNDLLYGDTVVLIPRVNIDGILNHIERCKVKSFTGVPSLYRMILEHDRVDYYDLSSLEYCFCAGDMLPLEVERKWRKKGYAPISQGYGTTETCGRISLTPIDENPPEGTAGKILPRVKYKLVDPDTLDPVPEGEPGEILISWDSMPTGYWRKPEETNRCFINLEGRLWYKTGDIVRVDKNGWLFYVDRTADIIKHKGYRISASEIETVLQEHPAVIASCVVGVPDEKVGERIKAFVVLKEDVKGVTGNELIRWCRERLASYKVPQYIDFRDMLPKSKVGKLLRREMRAEERKKQETAI